MVEHARRLYAGNPPEARAEALVNTVDVLSPFERIDIVDLQIAKWGDDLALRIPSDVARRLGLREGTPVKAQFTVDGGLSIVPSRWDRLAFAGELQEARIGMSMNAPSTEALRRDARY